MVRLNLNRDGPLYTTTRFRSHSSPKRTFSLGNRPWSTASTLAVVVLSLLHPCSCSLQEKTYPTPKYARRLQDTEAPVSTGAPTRNSPTLVPTKRPTGNPTFVPTSEPTESPSRQPTRRPSPKPTSEPTFIPTDEPTRRPSPQPTSEPTFVPTDEPTRRPSPQPTSEPTFVPTDQPTGRPTPRPTQRPTEQPSEEPTRRPTLEPTRIPTSSPSATPSDPPSPRPTESPTKVPTSSPTGPLATMFPTSTPSNVPSPLPSLVPSVTPSIAPTWQPSISPSEEPSISPSTSPTHTPSTPPPSGSPSYFPSVRPTESAMPSLSGAPSQAPSETWTYPKFQGRLTSSQIVLTFGGRRLQGALSAGECRELWESYVEDSVQTNIRLLVTTIEDLKVTVDNVTVEFLPDSVDQASYVFDTFVELRSPIPTHNVARFVGGSFDSIEERTRMKDYLRNTNCTEFESVTDVNYILPPRSGELNQEGVDDASSSRTGLAVGVTTAVVGVLVLTVALIIYRRRIQAPASEEVANPTPMGLPPVPRIPDRSRGANREVSTLGDPIPEWGGGDGDVSTLDDSTFHFDFHQQPTTVPEEEVMEGDESTLGGSTFNFDYRKQTSGMSASSPSSKEGTATDIVTLASNIVVAGEEETDEEPYTFEQTFEIRAPHGRLGLILETARDGVPVVNSISSGSPLRGQVEVGDKLLAVDELDVTVLTAGEVSKLIAAKSSQQERCLVFAREESYA